MKVRKDDVGLYIRSRWYGIDKDAPPYRPGIFSRSHIWNTTEAGLKEGDNPIASHVNGAPFIKITLANNQIVYWGTYFTK